MPTVVVDHKVKDQKVWLAWKKREEFFEPSTSRTFARLSIRKIRRGWQ